MDMRIQGEVRCSRCKELLVAVNQGFDRDNVFTVDVKPCPICLARADSNGFDRGHKAATRMWRDS